MKNYVKIGLLVAGAFVAYRLMHKNPTGLMLPEDWEHGELKHIYRGEDKDGYFLRCVWEDGYWSQDGGLSIDELNERAKRAELEFGIKTELWHTN